MTILVLSDSHSTLEYMRRYVLAEKPDVLVHLGDKCPDALTIHRENPDIPFYYVPGNCDGYSGVDWGSQTLVERIGGVTLYITHGHLHRVKSSLYALLRDARQAGADAVLYGHTHVPDCHQEEDGLWVLNPGSCGFFCRTAGLLQIEGGKFTQCRILGPADIGVEPMDL